MLPTRGDPDRRADLATDPVGAKQQLESCGRAGALRHLTVAEHSSSSPALPRRGLRAKAARILEGSRAPRSGTSSATALPRHDAEALDSLRAPPIAARDFLESRSHGPDPVGIRRMKYTIYACADQQGAAVILSSPPPRPGRVRLCQRVLIMKRGKRFHRADRPRSSPRSPTLARGGLHQADDALRLGALLWLAPALIPELGLRKGHASQEAQITSARGLPGIYL